MRWMDISRRNRNRKPCNRFPAQPKTFFGPHSSVCEDGCHGVRRQPRDTLPLPQTKRRALDGVLPVASYCSRYLPCGLGPAGTTLLARSSDIGRFSSADSIRCEVETQMKEAGDARV